MQSLESRRKLAYLGESDLNERMNMGERAKGEGGPGTGRYTAKERCTC